MAQNGVAQNGLTANGRDFYIAMLPGIPGGGSNAVFAFVTSYEANNTIKVSYFSGGAETAPTSYSISQKYNGVRIPLDRAAMASTPRGEVLDYAAAHITSTYPVTVQYYTDGPGNGEMYLALPTPTLGKTYVAQSDVDAPGIPGSFAKDTASSEFMIIGVANNTTVSITPNATTMHGKIGANTGDGATGAPHPFTITINRGQTYVVQSKGNDMENDMSNSIIQADKPIGVLSGHERAAQGPTEGSDGFGGADLRDMLVEQMIPVEAWQTDGYVSIPFVDHPFQNGMSPDGVGDMYRIYSYDPSTNHVDFYIGDAGANTRAISQLMNPPVQFDNVEAGVLALSPDKKKIAVDMVDNSQVLSWQAWTFPNDAVIIPMAKWAKILGFYVPANSQYGKDQYLNVIANKDSITSIQVYFNGSPMKLNSLAPAGSGPANFTIPQHPELKGLRFKVTPGAYVMRSSLPFAAYQYGYTYIDTKNNLDGFGYAAPCGEVLGSNSEPYKPRMDIVPECSAWTVHIYDSRPNDEGLADFMLLNDPDAIVTQPGHVSYNVMLNPTAPKFNVGDTAISFRVEVVNPLADAYAAIYAVDKAGNDTVFELTYKAPKGISLTPSTYTINNVVVGDQGCTQYVFHGAPNGNPTVVTGASFKLNSGNFVISSTVPAGPFPISVKPGDSLIVNVCYTAKDTGITHVDSLILNTSCYPISAEVKGRGVTPLIYATDADFGQVPIGQTVTRTVTVSNVGTGPLTITQNWVLHDKVHFKLLNPSALPITLPPHADQQSSVKLNFSYTPNAVELDSTWVDWDNNTRLQFAGQIKPYSILKGRGITPGIAWDRNEQDYPVICDSAKTYRIYLRNYGTAQDVVQHVTITGTDNAEFGIVATQNGYNPFEGFPINPGDSVWIDLKYTPDLTKGYVNRTATLFCIGTTDTTTVNLTAEIRHAELNISTNDINFGLTRPNTAMTQQVTITNPGNADLLITSVTIDNNAFTLIPANAIQAGTVIPAGGSLTVTVQGLLTADGNADGILSLVGSTPACTPDVKTNLHIAAATSSVLGTGNTFPNTYINCRQNGGTVTAKNLGSTPVVLKQVEIQDDPAFAGLSSEFNFTNGNYPTQILTPNVTLAAHSDTTFSVLFSPTLAQLGQAVVVYTWDTSAVPGTSPTFTTKAELIGTGEVVMDTLTAAATVSTGQYTAQVANTVDIPIRLTQPIPSDAGVYSVTFTVILRQDLFHLISFVPAPGFTYSNMPTNADLQKPGHTFDTLTITATSSTPITNASEIARLHMQVMLTKDTTSAISIGNLSFNDQTGASLCYVMSGKVDGDFAAQSICGDGTLRDYMNSGNQAFSIAEPNPNPAGSHTVLSYNVHAANTPLTIEIYNALGEKVQTIMQSQVHSAGAYQTTVDTKQLPSGTYIIRMSAPGFTSSRSVIVNK